MKTEFIDWLKGKEDFLNDEIDNCRHGFTPFDALLLAEVRGAINLYKQWLGSDCAKNWNGNDSDLSDQEPISFKRNEGVVEIRNNIRRSRLRRASDLNNSAWGTD